MSRRLQLSFRALLVAVSLLAPGVGWAWNRSGHMLSGAIAYQILHTESPATIAAVKATLEKHPWHDSRWKEQFEKVPESQRNEMLFMLAPPWADDIRRGKDKAQDRGPWHFINLPFKPSGQPPTVATKPPDAVNILTALAENEHIAKTNSDPAERAIALTWLFHLVGDIHQPLHAAQFFTTDYPTGDRGGNLICVKPSDTGRSMNLHEFWDGVITSSNKVTQLRNAATALRNRAEFSPTQLTELAATDFEAWAKESFEVAVKIAYRNGAAPGTPKGSAKDCTGVATVGVLPAGYTRTAGRIADRRIVLAGYRLAALLKRIASN